ncbi:putative aflatoxin biosynthesis ketoreductase nor-1 [Usnea florida]
MSTANNQIYLVTGANRGVRDPSASSSRALQSVNKHPSSVVIVVKIDNASATDAKTAVKCLQSDHDISKLDTVIVNAAVQNLIFAKLADVDPAQVQEHLSINAIGSLVLFQAVLPLLQKSSQPKFVVMGSAMGSIGGMEKRPFPMSAYGVSKAALHYLIRKIHFENEGLIAFAVDPGFVQSGPGNEAARIFGMEEAPVSIKECVEFVVATELQVDAATREKTSGHFPSIEGEDRTW